MSEASEVGLSCAGQQPRSANSACYSLLFKPALGSLEAVDHDGDEDMAPRRGRG